MDKINLKWLVYALLGIFILRVSGITSSFWLGMGIVGLVVIFALIQEIPAYKGWITALFALWILFFVVIPPFSKAYKKAHPDLDESYRILTEYSEKMAAIKIKPKQGKIAEFGGLKFCEEYEKVMTDWYNNALKDSMKSLTDKYPSDGKNFPDLIKWQREILGWAEQIREKREECDKFVRLSEKDGGAEKKTTDSKSEESRFAKFFSGITDLSGSMIFWLIGIAIIIAVIIGAVGKKDGRMPRIRNAIIYSILILAALLLLHKIIWGGWSESLKEKAVGIEMPGIFTSGKRYDWQKLVVELPEMNKYVDIHDKVPPCYYFNFRNNSGNYVVRYSDGSEESYLTKVSNSPTELKRISGNQNFIIYIKKISRKDVDKQIKEGKEEYENCY